MALVAQRGFSTPISDTTVLLKDDEGEYNVTLFENTSSECRVLFAVGSGGNPTRHLGLLENLFQAGCSVVAPHFDRLTSPQPSSEQLQRRAHRLTQASELIAPHNEALSGIGHSIGATVLLAMAGGELWMGPHQKVEIPTHNSLKRLVLMAAPTGYFQAPASLESVKLPVQAWVGTRDPITPVPQAEFLKDRIGDSVDLRIVEEGGHFSFMNSLPPTIRDSLADRDTFLESLTKSVTEFVQ